MVATSEIITTARGLRLEVETEDDVITRALRETGMWEEGVAQALDAYLEPGWTFLDIGAHIGHFSLMAAQKGNAVIAVEANGAYADRLQHNADMNGLKVEVHPVAVSDEEGDGFLKRDVRFIDNPAAAYLAQIGEVPVFVRHLETLLQGRRPEFVKLDIEGLEYAVMRDNLDLLDKAKVVIVEVGAVMARRFGVRPLDVVELLRQRGYGVTFIDGTPLDDRIIEMSGDFYTNLLARKGFVEDPKALSSKKVKPATVLLCAWRGIVVETHECMQQMWDRGWGVVTKRGDALITRSRSVAVSHWYQNTDEDVFLMIDDDVVFRPEHAERVVELAREKQTIVCAAYPVKDGGHLACRRKPEQTEIVFGRGAEPIEIVYPATGFMAVPRKVIDAMVAAKNADGSAVFPYCDATGGLGWWPFFDCFTIQHDNGKYEYLSEDYAFGEQALRLGFKTWLDPSVVLFHIGQYPYTISNMKHIKNLEVEG